MICYQLHSGITWRKSRHLQRHFTTGKLHFHLQGAAEGFHDGGEGVEVQVLPTLDFGDGGLLDAEAGGEIGLGEAVQLAEVARAKASDGSAVHELADPAEEQRGVVVALGGEFLKGSLVGGGMQAEPAWGVHCTVKLPLL